MAASDLIAIFTALAPLPWLQWLFGFVVIGLCVVLFLRQKPAQATPVSPSTTLPGLGEPQAYFQGPVAMMKLHEQKRDLLLVIVEELKSLNRTMEDIEARQSRMELEDIRSGARRKNEP